MKASTIKIIAFLLVLIGLSNIFFEEFLKKTHIFSPLNFLIGILVGMLIANAIITKQRQFLLIALIFGLFYFVMLSIFLIRRS